MIDPCLPGSLKDAAASVAFVSALFSANTAAALPLALNPVIVLAFVLVLLFAVALKKKKKLPEKFLEKLQKKLPKKLLTELQLAKLLPTRSPE